MKWPRDLRKSKHYFCSRKCHYTWKRKQHFKPHNFKANYVTCEYCGKIFPRAPANVKNHIFCSTECYLNYSRETLVCPACGKTFARRKSRIKYDMTFCSVECSRIWHRGKNSSSYVREQRECLVCGGKFEVKPSSRKKFCSHTCFYQWLRETRNGEANPYWKPKIIKKCAICGKPFETYPSNPNRKFCSDACFRKWLKIHGISDDNRKKMLKALLKRPTKPEKKLMKIIEDYNLPFKYVGNGALIIGGLNPDFISRDGKEIIEVFGTYWHNPEICKGTMREDVRKAVFLQLGYKILILWEHELNANDEPKIVNKILRMSNSRKLKG